MTATYIKIDKAPKFAPDCNAVVRVSTGSSYKYWYVDSKADAKAFCRDRGLTLEFAA